MRIAGAPEERSTIESHLRMVIIWAFEAMIISLGRRRMDALSRNDLLGFLNMMLEAERAGAKALLHISRDTRDSDIAALAKDIQKDEARWCAMLTMAIRNLGGDPSAKTGQFYEKVMALAEDGARLDLVNRGQDWVVRKLSEVLPKITDPQLYRDLTEMLASHKDNIARVAGSDLFH